MIARSNARLIAPSLAHGSINLPSRSEKKQGHDMGFSTHLCNPFCVRWKQHTNHYLCLLVDRIHNSRQLSVLHKEQAKTYDLGYRSTTPDPWRSPKFVSYHCLIINRSFWIVIRAPQVNYLDDFHFRSHFPDRITVHPKSQGIIMGNTMSQDFHNTNNNKRPPTSQ